MMAAVDAVVAVMAFILSRAVGMDRPINLSAGRLVVVWPVDRLRDRSVVRLVVGCFILLVGPSEPVD